MAFWVCALFVLIALGLMFMGLGIFSISLERTR